MKLEIQEAEEFSLRRPLEESYIAAPLRTDGPVERVVPKLFPEVSERFAGISSNLVVVNPMVSEFDKTNCDAFNEVKLQRFVRETVVAVAENVVEVDVLFIVALTVFIPGAVPRVRLV